MKKLSALILAAAMCFSLLTSCGDGGKTNGGGSTPAGNNTSSGG